MSVTTEKKEKVKFSKAFWVANTVELLERAAYYGVFVVITLYLSNVLGFTDIQAATIAGVFSACLYLLPTFSGALADKIGCQRDGREKSGKRVCYFLRDGEYRSFLRKGSCHPVT